MGAINKIVFFIASPFNKRDEERFGVEVLQENGFEVEVWDFTPVLYPERFQKYVPVDKSSIVKSHIFHSKRDIITGISKLMDTCLIFNLIDYGVKSCFIYRAITRQGLAHCLYWYHFPVFGMPNKRGAYGRLRTLNIEKVMTRLFALIPYRYWGIRRATFLMVAGGGFSLPDIPVDEETRLILTHHFDYEMYLREAQKPADADSGMVVFLDQYFPFHPDPPSGYTLPPPEEYYRLMRGFFDYLERDYGVHIVIAAHPRSDYGKHPDYFGKRDVVFGKTPELVRKSRFAVLHDSASLNYAILFRKPMIFTTTNYLQQIRGGLTDYIAAMFGKKPLNLNHNIEVDLDKELSVNEEAYESYKNIYIKRNGTPDIPTWQAFADCLKDWKT